MAGSLNRVMLIGNLGQDPDIRSMQNGGRVCNLSIATSESWKDRNTGERKEKTEWHRVVVFNEGLVGVIENYVKKGSKVFIEGQLETRSWEQDGQKKYTTEIVIKNYNGSLTMLDGRNDNQGGGGYQQNNNYSQAPSNGGGQQQQQQSNAAPVHDDFEDDIPF